MKPAQAKRVLSAGPSRTFVRFLILSVSCLLAGPSFAQLFSGPAGVGSHQGKVRIQLVSGSTGSDVADANVVLSADGKISLTTNVGCAINTSLVVGTAVSETFFGWIGKADLQGCSDPRFNFTGGSLTWRASGYEDIIVAASGTSPSGTIMLSGTVKRAVPVPPPPKLPDYTGAWYNPQESGWGVSMISFPGNSYGMITYHYDAANQPVWYFHAGTLSGTTYTTTLRYLTGPYFGSGAFNMLNVRRTTVGNVTINFQSTTQATLSYTVNGVTVNKNLVKLSF